VLVEILPAVRDGIEECRCLSIDKIDIGRKHTPPAEACPVTEPGRVGMTFASRDMLGSILPIPIGIEGLLCTAGRGLRLNCLQSLGRVTVEAWRRAARRP